LFQKGKMFVEVFSKGKSEEWTMFLCVHFWRTIGTDARVFYREVFDGNCLKRERGRRWNWLTFWNNSTIYVSWRFLVKSAYFEFLAKNVSKRKRGENDLYPSFLIKNVFRRKGGEVLRKWFSSSQNFILYLFMFLENFWRNQLISSF